MANHERILPPLKPIEGFRVPRDLFNVLSPKERRELREDLAETARVRRRALGTTSKITLG